MIEKQVEEWKEEFIKKSKFVFSGIPLDPVYANMDEALVGDRVYGSYHFENNKHYIITQIYIYYEPTAYEVKRDSVILCTDDGVIKF